MRIVIDTDRWWITKLIRRYLNIPPKNWHEYHLSTCGTEYRGCDPKCPKNVWEEEGKWIN